MGLFGIGSKREVKLVIEIGSGGVAGAFFAQKKGMSPLIMASVRREFPLRIDASLDRMKADLVSDLPALCTQLQKIFPGRPSEIHIILGTPWAHGELRTLVYESTKEFPFTEKLGAKLIKTELGRINEMGGRKLIDHRVVGVSLNGFPVARPQGIACRTAAIETFFSFASKLFTDELRDSIHTIWKSRIVFSSSLLRGFIVMRDIVGSTHDIFMIDVGAEASELLLIEGGVPAGTATISLGERTFIRDAARTLGQSVVETRSLFMLMQGNSLDGRAAERALDAFATARDAWLEAVKTTLMTLMPARRIPAEIVVLSDSPIARYLIEGMRPAFFPEFTIALREFDVILGDMKALHESCEFASGAMRDARLAMGAIFIQRSLL